MKFKDQIPEEVFKNPFVDKFVSVLDGANEFKEFELFRSNSFYRPVLASNRKYLIAILEDLGLPTIPSDFPKDVLDALYLNMEDINALRGSKQGLILWLWCLTFGAITVDDSAFFPVPNYIQPSSLTNGFVSRFSPLYTPTIPQPQLFLFDDLSQFGTTTLVIDIATKYHNFTSIVDYINKHIKKYLTFVTSNAVITINFTNGPYVTNSFPHQFFVLP